MKFHPHDSLLLEAFGSLSRERRRPVLEHLEQCPRCRKRLGDLHRWKTGALAKKLGSLTRPSTGLNDYDSALEQAFRRFQARQDALEKERSAAVDLLPKLLEEAPERREWLIKKEPKYQTWGLLEFLLDKANQATQKAPVSGEPLIQLARTLATNLDETYYGRERLEDLRARTWSILGNTFRMRYEFPAAEVAFKTAESHLRSGTGDPLERAGLLVLKSSMWRYQRKFDEALHLLQRALSIYTEAGNVHQAASALLNIDLVHNTAGRPLDGLPFLEQATELAESLRDPMFSLYIWHNLASNLSKAGRFMEAQRAFLKARPLYAQYQGCPDRALIPKSIWIEGRLALGRRQFREAQELFQKAKDGLAAHGVASGVMCLEDEMRLARAGKQPERTRKDFKSEFP